MPGITDQISSATLGATEKVTIKTYGDGTVAYTPTLVTSATVASGGTSATGVVSTNGIRVGDPVVGTGIPANTFVGGFVVNTSIAFVKADGTAQSATSASSSLSINKSHNSIGERRTERNDPREGWMGDFISSLLIVA